MAFKRHISHWNLYSIKTMFQQPNHLLNSPETAQSSSERLSLSSELGRTGLQVREVIGLKIQFNFENIVRHLLYAKSLNLNSFREFNLILWEVKVQRFWHSNATLSTFRRDSGRGWKETENWRQMNCAFPYSTFTWEQGKFTFLTCYSSEFSYSAPPSRRGSLPAVWDKPFSHM